jgi:hypothetical protein
MAKRRPNGGGAISRRADGRYMGRAYVTDTDGNRVRKTVYGATWDQANEKLGKLQDQERNGVPVPSRSWTLGEWLTYWLEHIVQPEREGAGSTCCLTSERSRWSNSPRHRSAPSWRH